ncbi:MAG: sigma-70 family RNA polymerase sigma factor [Candidatus Omnitrophica bacterium]|nr:sigma-70 family RNA polymerase sigma factor [Candidatus Omnitrophota bacterium]
MTFELLVKRLTPKLKGICYKLNRRFTYFNEEDLFQEALLGLWKKFEAGALTDKTDSYILQGCSFALRNYIRTALDRVTPMSIEASVDENDVAREETLALRDVRFDSYFESLNDKFVAEVIRNNGLTRREKELLPFFAEGLTVREIGRRLGVSHVMVLKMRETIRKKCLKHLDAE